MHPVVSAEGSSVPQGIYDVFRNSNFTTESTHVMNLIRKHQRPKISLLSPNPAYLSAFYQNVSYNSNVNQKGFHQKLSQPVEKTILQQSYKRKYQADVSCPQVLDRKASPSSSPPHKALRCSDSHSSKTNLLQNITRIDGNIAKVEFELVEKNKIEDVKKKPSIKQLKQVSEPVRHSLFKKIIAENQQKAHEAHSIMLNLCPQLDFPVYNQPCDTAVYHENKKHFIKFKQKLMVFLRKKCVRRMKTQKSLLKLYSHLACKWKNNINKIESSRRRKSEEAKNRKYFETVFPELQKKKSTRERSKRNGDHVLSEADYQEILRRLEFENLEYTLLKSSSAHSPVLLDLEQRGKFFQNQNNLITDVKGTGEKQFFNLWTLTEKAIFKEKFIQCSKDFGQIASFLDKKSVSDCVKYYYLTKKRENYKISGKSKQIQHEMLQQFSVANEKLQPVPTPNISTEK